MKLMPGEVGSMNIELGKQTIFKRNRPLAYEIVTVNGSVIEVTLPAGIDLLLTSQGDIKEINIKVFDSPTGPQEAV